MYLVYAFNVLHIHITYMLRYSAGNVVNNIVIMVPDEC